MRRKVKTEITLGTTGKEVKAILTKSLRESGDIPEDERVERVYQHVGNDKITLYLDKDPFRGPSFKMETNE